MWIGATVGCAWRLPRADASGICRCQTKWGRPWPAICEVLRPRGQPAGCFARPVANARCARRWLSQRVGRRHGARGLGGAGQTSASVAPNFCHAPGPAGSQSQGGGRFTGPRQSEHHSGLCQSQSADAAGRGPTLARGGAADESTLSQSGRRVLPGRAAAVWALRLESEGALLENLVAARSAASPPGTLDHRVGAELGAGAPAGQLAAAGTPPGGGAALRALLGGL